MDVNALPRSDTSVNETGCCPRFEPAGWDGQELHFRDKPFLRAETRSMMHVPLNMGKVFARVQKAVEAAGGFDTDDLVVLSRDITAFRAEHLFAVPRKVAGEQMVTLSGDFVTRVFEGPYRMARDWYGQMEDLVRARGSPPRRIYFYYTTCPRCAKHYGRNYVIGVAEV